MMPKPLQPGGVPIWVSGTVNKNVVRRIIRFGSGWIPWGPDRVDVKTGIAKMREALAAGERDPSTLDIVGLLPIVDDRNGATDLARTMDRVPELVAAGVTDFRVNTEIPDEPAEAADFYPIENIRPGQIGIGRTIFKGDKIEEFRVEVLGVLRKSGPHQDQILAKLSGGPKTGPA